MNKKAQAGPIALIFLVILFLVNWFLWLGDFISDVCRQAVIDNNLSGMEAFLFNNINMIILIVIILAIMGWGYFASQ